MPIGTDEYSRRILIAWKGDETFVPESYKGSGLPEDFWRMPRLHGAKAQKRGISDEYICICTGVGRGGRSVAKSLNRVKSSSSELKAAFECYLDERNLVICDGFRSYNILNSKYGCTVKDENNEDKFFHFNWVNEVHSFIKHQYVKYRGMATKYLNRYKSCMQRHIGTLLPSWRPYTICSVLVIHRTAILPKYPSKY